MDELHVAKDYGTDEEEDCKMMGEKDTEVDAAPIGFDHEEDRRTSHEADLKNTWIVLSPKPARVSKI